MRHLQISRKAFLKGSLMVTAGLAFSSFKYIPDDPRPRIPESGVKDFVCAAHSDL